VNAGRSSVMPVQDQDSSARANWWAVNDRVNCTADIQPDHPHSGNSAHAVSPRFDVDSSSLSQA
jgi:hypothetical protein